ncbi:C2H2 zinc finger [Ceratobasidium sp. AG-Ba]|nr:C2H2 zinc finger [Ceratobasidium sp. AG-Ba]
MGRPSPTASVRTPSDELGPGFLAKRIFQAVAISQPNSASHLGSTTARNKTASLSEGVTSIGQSLLPLLKPLLGLDPRHDEDTIHPDVFTRLPVSGTSELSSKLIAHCTHNLTHHNFNSNPDEHNPPPPYSSLFPHTLYNSLTSEAVKTEEKLVFPLSCARSTVDQLRSVNIQSDSGPAPQSGFVVVELKTEHSSAINTDETEVSQSSISAQPPTANYDSIADIKQEGECSKSEGTVESEVARPPTPTTGGVIIDSKRPETGTCKLLPTLTDSKHVGGGPKIVGSCEHYHVDQFVQRASSLIKTLLGSRRIHASPPITLGRPQPKPLRETRFLAPYNPYNNSHLAYGAAFVCFRPRVSQHFCSSRPARSPQIFSTWGGAKISGLKLKTCTNTFSENSALPGKHSGSGHSFVPEASASDALPGAEDVWPGEGFGHSLMDLETHPTQSDPLAKLDEFAQLLGGRVVPVAHFNLLQSLLSHSVNIPPQPPVPLIESSVTPLSSVLASSLGPIPSFAPFSNIPNSPLSRYDGVVLSNNPGAIISAETAVMPAIETTEDWLVRHGHSSHPIPQTPNGFYNEAVPVENNSIPLAVDPVASDWVSDWDMQLPSDYFHGVPENINSADQQPDTTTHTLPSPADHFISTDNGILGDTFVDISNGDPGPNSPPRRRIPCTEQDCNRTFSRPGLMRSHIRSIHQGIKGCSKAYSLNANLKRHVMEKHKGNANCSN